MTDWCVGDLALCIESGIYTREGRSYTVIAVTPPGEQDCFGYWNNSQNIALDFAEVPHGPGNGSGSERFRKIRPDTHEACEAEFVTLLKRTKRKVEA